MPPRLFTPAPLAAGAIIPATPAQAHHLGTVLRRAPDSPVHLFNGRDGEWAGRIGALGSRAATVVVETEIRPQAPEPDLWLVFALLKRDATDLIAQKATELGVSELLPVVTERTNAARVNEARLAAIAVEAAEQSERLTVPKIRPPQPLSRLLAAWPRERRLVAAFEREAAPWPRPAPGPVALLIGPEGGFAPTELDALRRHPFVEPASLGPRILRAETAALAGLALLQSGAVAGG